jgi:4-amino-4-deoxy-L-arabinose transferase-like glycosyltransferase
MTTDLTQARREGVRPGSIARAARWIALVAIVVHMFAAWFARPPGILTGQDDAEYVILARSLRGGGYQELHRVDAPVHSTYPPGYPALLAAWGAVTGDDFDALVVLNVVLSAAALLLLRRALLRRGFDETVATGSVVVLALNPALVAFAGSVMSEVPYILLTTLCLLLLADDDPRTRSLALAGAAAILAALTRSIGITLLGALGALWLIERRWKPLGALVAASALTVGVWLLWTVLAPEQYLGTSYVADLRAGATKSSWSPGPLLRIPGHIAWYARAGVPWTLAIPTVPGTVIDNAVVVALLALLGGVGVWTFVRRWRLAALYLAAYGGLIAVWLWRTDRFAIPLLPLIVPALLVGAHELAVLLKIRRPWLLPTACALFLATAAGLRTGGAVAAALRCDRSAVLPDAECLTPDQASYFAAIRWIRDNTADDDVLLAAKSAPLWLYAGRHSVGYGTALSGDTTTFVPFLRDNGVDYVLLGVLEQNEVWQLAPLMAGVCGNFTLEATFPPGTYLFRLPAEGEAVPAGAACAAVSDYRTTNGSRRF